MNVKLINFHANSIVVNKFIILNVINFIRYVNLSFSIKIINT